MGNFRDLPLELALDTLTRLPAELILDCKLVSKPWKDFVSHPSFYQLYKNRLLSGPDNTGTLGFIFKSGGDEYFYTKYDENSGTCSRKTKFKFRPPVTFYSVLDSCSGLICFSACYARTGYQYEPVCIGNPLTKEYIVLPRIKRSSKLLSGFGYCHSTNEFKVVRMHDFSKDKLQVEVYTLGSGNGWRDAGIFDFMIESYTTNGVFANEALYWLHKNRTIITAFNLADEKFCEFPTPPDVPDRGNLYLGVLGEFLSCTFSYHASTSFYDIWLLKKNGDDNRDMSWSKEFSIVGYEPLAYLKSGELLCHVEHQPNIFRYNLEDSSSKMVENFEEYTFGAIPHKNTLVSMEALGEKETKIMVSGEAERNEETESGAEKKRRGDLAVISPVIRRRWTGKRF